MVALSLVLSKQSLLYKSKTTPPLNIIIFLTKVKILETRAGVK